MLSLCADGDLATGEVDRVEVALGEAAGRMGDLYDDEAKLGVRNDRVSEANAATPLLRFSDGVAPEESVAPVLPCL